MTPKGGIKGRGSAENPTNRFTDIDIVAVGPALARIDTAFSPDWSRSVISSNSSPDVGFDRSLNPYRGCEHGCSYCYARPTHEYLGLSAGIDFETKIMVKENAAALLERELLAPGWRPQLLALSGVTDAYQPIEKRLEITRGCLEVLAELRNPLMVITKNRLVTRDVDLLASLAAVSAAGVFVSICTLEGGLASKLEPRASHPRNRLDAMRVLSASGIPVGVLVAPIIPGLTDHEIPEIVSQAALAGATYARYTLLRLPGAVEQVFTEWLQRCVPQRADKILNRIRSIRGGKLNESAFGSRFHGRGVFAKQIRDLFYLSCRREGLATDPMSFDIRAFRGRQMSLFAFPGDDRG